MERIARSLGTESITAADAVVEQLGYDAVARIRPGLERACSAVLVPCLVALTRAFVVAATSFRWKSKESRD